MIEFEQGSVHGRFQPLHNDHLRYILTAKSKCRFLWIGVTQYNILALGDSPKDPHRQEALHNPLTYFERVDMIGRALTTAGVPRAEFGVLPFPIDVPAYLPAFLPTNIPVFTTVYDDWNRHKVATLEGLGYTVVVLWEERVKAIDGMTVRKAIIRGDESWKTLVPKATVDIVREYHVAERLHKLSRELDTSCE